MSPNLKSIVSILVIFFHSKMKVMSLIESFFMIRRNYPYNTNFTLTELIYSRNILIIV